MATITAQPARPATGLARYFPILQSKEKDARTQMARRAAEREHGRHERRHHRETGHARVTARC